MAGKKSCKTLWIELASLQGQSGVAAHLRISIAVKLFDNADFLADIGITDHTKAADVLNGKFEDLCLSFSELRSMYQAFPNADDWKDGKLRTLYNRTLEIAEANKPEPTKRSVNRKTNKEYEELESEKEDAVCQLVYTKSENDRLRDENTSLRNEKMRLEGRIEELEKLLTPQLT